MVRPLLPNRSLTRPSGHRLPPAARPGNTPRVRANTRGCGLGSATKVKPQRASDGPCPWPPQHPGRQRPAVTHGGTTQNSPHSREIPASEPFSQRVAGNGFKPSSAEPTVYSPSLLAEWNAADQRIHHSRSCPWPTWSAICPCAGSPGRRDFTDGHGPRGWERYADRSAWSLASIFKLLTSYRHQRFLLSLAGQACRFVVPKRKAMVPQTAPFLRFLGTDGPATQSVFAGESLRAELGDLSGLGRFG
jgi:hypothetical protein